MNRKKRTLQYIRNKNALRLRREHRFYFKISNLMIKDVDYFKYFIDKSVKNKLNILNNRYKVNYKYELVDKIIGNQDDDFLKELQTILIVFKRL